MHKNKDFTKVIVELENDGFMVKEHEFAGETVFLINPQHIGCTWTEDNLIYRSSVWDKDGNAVSLSWKKFFNFGEQIQLIPDPTDLRGAVVMDKRDGSTLIVSVFNNEWMIRTRGTVDATNLNNGYEIEQLKVKYPEFFNEYVKKDIVDNNISVLFEWETPNNRIVLNNCDEPQIILIGIIDNSNYKYYPNAKCDDLAVMWDVERPKQYNFKTLDELVDWVRASSGIEGGCIYFGGGQEIKKIKSIEYLKLHAFRFNMAGSYKPLAEYVVNQRTSDVRVLKKHIIDTYDFECWEFIEDKVIEVVKAFNEILNELTCIYISLIRVTDQKEFAMAIMKDYKNFSAYLFQMRKKGFNVLDDLLDDERMCKKFSVDIVNILEAEDVV